MHFLAKCYMIYIYTHTHIYIVFSALFMPVAKLIICAVINLRIRSMDDLPEVSTKDAYFKY